MTIIDYDNFIEFFDSYLESLLWALALEPEENDYVLTARDIDKMSRDILRSHAMSFYSRCHYLVPNTGHQTFGLLGHTFALHQIGSGVGFFDGEWDHEETFCKLADNYMMEIDYESLF